MSGNEESAARPVLGSAEELVKDPEERERKRAAIKARIEAQKKAEDVQRIDERYGSFFIEPKPDEAVLYHLHAVYSPTTQIPLSSLPSPALSLPFSNRRPWGVWVSLIQSSTCPGREELPAESTCRMPTLLHDQQCGARNPDKARR
jgi:hypothetical protein